MHALATYLVQRLPEGMIYADVARLCIRLYCTVEGVPESLLPLSRVELSEAFADLVRAGWVLQAEGQTATCEHWNAVITEVLIQGPSIVDFPRGELLAQSVGFDKSGCDAKETG